jgi:hypothetical protein
MADLDLKALLKRVVELVMPNLRSYYRLPRKGRVVKAYPCTGQYWADVQVLRNDESDDADEPVIPRVEIPVLWAGPDRGVVCPPVPGTLCDITYYDGDPDYPRISNFRWAKNTAPACALGGFVIRQGAGCYFLIKPDGTFELKGNLKLIGALHATGGIISDVSIADDVRSMAADRAIYNRHTNPGNGTSPPPEQM